MSIKGSYFERISLLHFFDIGKLNLKLIDLPFIKNAKRPQWFDNYQDLVFKVEKFEDFSKIPEDSAYLQHLNPHILISPSNFAGPDGILFLEQSDKKLLILFGIKYTSNSITSSVSLSNEFATNIYGLNNKILRILLEFEDSIKNVSTCQFDDDIFTITLTSNDIIDLFYITNNPDDKMFASRFKTIINPESPENFPKPSEKIEPKYPERRKSARLQARENEKRSIETPNRRRNTNNKVSTKISDKNSESKILKKQSKTSKRQRKNNNSTNKKRKV